jgi:hypothetical protein
VNLSRSVLSHILIGILAALAIIGIVVLIATDHPVPDYLSLIAVSGLGALAGVALPDVPAGGVSTELTTLVGGLAGKLDTLIGHVLGHDANTVTVASGSAETIEGGPLPAATPATDDTGAST